jgi:myo-inositol 2-dehydrogenase / D-chiro-inositol 1-dehydrogenase
METARGTRGTGMSDEVRILVAGAGRAGMVHGRNFAAGIAGARLAAIADPDRAARERAGTELGCDRVFDDPVAAASEEGIDAIVVASPTPTHAEVAIAALKSDKHVLCEKPLASGLEEAGAIARAVAGSRGTLSMAFMRRFDAGFMKAANRIAAGDIGRPLLVRSTGRGPGLPPEWAWDVERSGGLIAEVNSHDLDTVRWLSGQEFAAVYATGRASKRPDIAQRYPGFIDVVAATFDLDDGGIGLVDGACPAGYGYDARAEVYGTDGMLTIGSPSASTTMVSARGRVETEAVSSWRDLFADAYRAEDAHLVAVARGDDEPRPTVADGLRALEAVVAVNRSMSEGRQVMIEEIRSS